MSSLGIEIEGADLERITHDLGLLIRFREENPVFFRKFVLENYLNLRDYAREFGVLVTQNTFSAGSLSSSGTSSPGVTFNEEMHRGPSDFPDQEWMFHSDKEVGLATLHGIRGESYEGQHVTQFAQSETVRAQAKKLVPSLQRALGIQYADPAAAFSSPDDAVLVLEGSYSEVNRGRRFEGDEAVIYHNPLEPRQIQQKLPLLKDAVLAFSYLTLHQSIDIRSWVYDGLTWMSPLATAFGAVPAIKDFSQRLHLVDGYSHHHQSDQGLIWSLENPRVVHAMRAQQTVFPIPVPLRRGHVRYSR